MPLQNESLKRRKSKIKENLTIKMNELKKLVGKKENKNSFVEDKKSIQNQGILSEKKNPGIIVKN